MHLVTAARSTPADAPQISHHKSNFSFDSLTSTFANIRPDVVISTSSGGSYDTQKCVIDACIAAQVPRFIPAEFGQDSLNDGIQKRLPPTGERAGVINYLQNIPKNEDFEWCAVATGYTLDHGLLSGNLGFDLKWQSATVPGNGSESFAASSAAWHGRVVKATLERWDSVQGQYLYAAGLTTSADAIKRDLQIASGKDWEVGYVDVEDILREAERRLDRGFPDAGMFLMERSVLFDERLGAERPFVEQDAKAVLGLEAEHLEGIIHSVLHQQKHNHGKADCGCD